MQIWSKARVYRKKNYSILTQVISTVLLLELQLVNYRTMAWRSHGSDNPDLIKNLKSKF